MLGPNQKLATSLTAFRELQKDGRRVFQSRELSRIDRERLLLNGFVQEVMKGWLISSSPDSRDGDSTPWYASFWEFCARYCSRRFGNEWCLSPEESFLLHAEKTVIPPVVIVQSPKGTNHDLSLLFGTSLYDLKQARMPPPAELTLRNGLRLFTPEAALIRVSESFITNNPIETRVVVAGLRDTTELLRLLLAGGHSVIAGRLAGTLRRTGRPDAAREIIATMKATGYDVREIDPFAGQQALGPAPASTAPIVGRMQAMWHSMREKVLEAFPPPPGLPIDKNAYLQSIDEIYRSDAYHSLSIEGYRVSPELIERVRAGSWDPKNHDADRQSRDALAARGYWQAFQSVKGNIAGIIAGENAGRAVRAANGTVNSFSPALAPA